MMETAPLSMKQQGIRRSYHVFKLFLEVYNNREEDTHDEYHGACTSKGRVYSKGQSNSDCLQQFLISITQI